MFYAVVKHSTGKVWAYRFRKRKWRDEWVRIDGRRRTCTHDEAYKALRVLNASRHPQDPARGIKHPVNLSYLYE